MTGRHMRGLTLAALTLAFSACTHVTGPHPYGEDAYIVKVTGLGELDRDSTRKIARDFCWSQDRVMVPVEQTFEQKLSDILWCQASLIFRCVRPSESGSSQGRPSPPLA